MNNYKELEKFDRTKHRHINTWAVDVETIVNALVDRVNDMNRNVSKLTITKCKEGVKENG